MKKPSALRARHNRLVGAEGEAGLRGNLHVATGADIMLNRHHDSGIFGFKEPFVAFDQILVDALEGGDVPSGDVTPVLARQLAGLGDAHLRSRLAALDPLPTSAGDAATRIDQWKSRLSPLLLATGDPVAGRRVWLKQCAACHRMHGEGGTLGPDLTGSGRHDLDYLLANIVTPSATVSPDYRMRQVVLADGRVLSGIVVRRTSETLLLRTPTGEETVPSADVDAVIDGGVSLMPEGLLDRLDNAEAIDLIRFLMEP